MGVILGIGRVLSVIGLIGRLMASVIKLIMAVPRMAANQRRQLAQVDPVLAAQEAQVMISALQANIAVARDPRVRASYAQFTQAQIAFQQAAIPVRIGAAQVLAQAGTAVAYAGAGFANLLSGAFGASTGGVNNAAFGVGLLGSVFGSLYGWLPPGLAALISSVQTAQARASSNGMFINDFMALTAGNYSPTRAYPSNRGAGNWWR